MIKNVSEFLDAIRIIEKKNNLFFRGHSNSNYSLNPGIYRNAGDKTLIEFEERIYRDIIAKAPNAFVGKNTLESLALIQHYGAPTRLLDLTENALVALYFAAQNKNDEDGEVIVFDIPDFNTCHFNSDRATILSNLAKCESDFSYQNYDTIILKETRSKLTSKLQEFLLHEIYENNLNQDFFAKLVINEEIIENTENLEDYVDAKKLEYSNSFNLEKEDEPLFKNQIITTIINKVDSNIYSSIETVNDLYFRKLLHNIREDKPYFDSIIDPTALNQVYAVRPKLDNPRIIRQQGALLLFGVQDNPFLLFGDIKPMAKINEDWIIKGNSESKLLIDKDSKKAILDELEGLGLNKSTLFPEVDKVAEYIKDKYTNKLNSTTY